MSGLIVTKSGKQYALTAGDRLWLMRAVQAEGPVQSQVAEALVNLFALTLERKGNGTSPLGGQSHSLQSLVRAYAQPVNPRWYAAGDLHLAALAKAKTPAERASLESLAEKRENFHSTRNVFDPAVIAAVESALRGRHATDVTDYAAQHIDARAKGYEARSEPRPGQNRLWTRKPGWAGYAASAAAWGASGGVLVVAALALVTWWSLRA